MPPPAQHGLLLRWRREQFPAAGRDDLPVDEAGTGGETDALSVLVDDVSSIGWSSFGKAGRRVGELGEAAEPSIPDRQEAPPPARPSDDDDDWIRRLTAAGRAHEDAVAQLYELLLRAARHQVSRMPQAGALGATRREEIIRSAADEATVSVLARLGTFEGRSAFTTWAYKFAILHAGTELRRAAWPDREINLDDIPELRETVAPSPELYAEGRDLAQALRNGLQEALTPYQRRVAVAILIDEAPIDVLAERLGTSRGALYKTLHDARKRLRVYLADHGFLPARTRREVTR
jgi:RNA polymerase sigma-70 factor (ECF subfamily)